jgi:hypothetical protein
VRLPPVEQRVIEDLARWYGPAGSRRHELVTRAVVAWLVEFRRQFEAGDVGPSWELSRGRRATPIKGCWRVHFSTWDVPRKGAHPKAASGARGERIVVEVIVCDGEPAIRVLSIGPKHAGSGPGRRAWVYERAAERRQHPYVAAKKGGDQE